MSIVLINLIGQTGPFLGTNVFPTQEGPRYVKGMSVCAAFMFFSGGLAIAQRFLLAWENAKLDQEHGPPSYTERADTESEKIALENYGPNFRYVL